MKQLMLFMAMYISFYGFNIKPLFKDSKMFVSFKKYIETFIMYFCSMKYHNMEYEVRMAMNNQSFFEACIDWDL